MIKYLPESASVVLEEVPDKISLAIDITNCRGFCEGCHTPFLRGDYGEELTPAAIDSLLEDNFGVNCFLFLGEGADPEALLALTQYLNRRYPDLALALYSGLPEIDGRFWKAFDYIKTGPFIKERGPLDNPKTNQRMYRLERGKGLESAVDITSRFHRRGLEARGE